MKQEEDLRKSRMYHLADRWKESGMNQKEFSKTAGVSYYVLNYWIKKQREEFAGKHQKSGVQQKESPAGFVPLDCMFVKA